MMKKSSAVALLVASVFVAPSFATTSGKVTRSDFNRDGALSRAEACAGRTPNVCKNFSRIDANADGVVTRREIRNFNNARRMMKGKPPKP
jgi:hypothetical protein